VKRIRKRPARVINELVEGLEEISELLPTNSFVENDDDDDDDSIDASPSIDSEEIEVALSGLVSSLSDRLDLKVEPVSLSALLELLFSPEDDVVSLAVNLEDAVNGYFGELFGENLDLAEIYFADLIAILKERREKWKPQKG
jgi:hypothetical protein